MAKTTRIQAVTAKNVLLKVTRVNDDQLSMSDDHYETEARDVADFIAQACSMKFIQAFAEQLQTYVLESEA